MRGEVAWASISSHLSCHFDGFKVHRDARVTFSEQFLDDLATHLRITTGFTIPFDLNLHFSFTQLLVRTAQQTHRLVPPAAQDHLGEGVVLGPCATALGFTTGLWLAAARAERVVRGAVDGLAVRDWLAAVNDGVPTNAVVMRPVIGFEIPKGAISPLILIVMQDPGSWGGVPVKWLLLQTAVVHS